MVTLPPFVADVVDVSDGLTGGDDDGCAVGVVVWAGFLADEVVVPVGFVVGVGLTQAPVVPLGFGVALAECETLALVVGLVVTAAVCVGVAVGVTGGVVLSVGVAGAVVDGVAGGLLVVVAGDAVTLGEA